MTMLQAFVLGAIQGLTEFLPISSSGHLVFVPHLFAWPDQGLSFDVVVHLGSLLAVLIYFRKTLLSIIKAFLGIASPTDPKERTAHYRALGWYLIFATIPALLAGLVMTKVWAIEIRSTMVVAVSLIGWGVVLWIADRYASRLPMSKRRVDQDCKSALLIGCAQAIALIPGTSRSGITMTAGLFCRLSKKAAAEFSFLLSVPVIALAGGVKMFELFQQGFEGMSLLVLGVGFISAAASGFVAISLLMKMIQKWSFVPFAIYRIVVGLLILLFLV